MMRVIRLLLAATLLQSGCTHRYYLTSYDSMEYRSLVRKAERSKCAVVLKTGFAADAEGFQLAPEWTRFRMYPAGDSVRVPTGELESVTFVSHRDGAIEGGVIGLGAGLGVGALAGLVTAAATGAEFGTPGPWGNLGSLVVLLGAIGGAPVGMVVGALRGGIAGTKHVYYPVPADSSAAPSDTTAEQVRP